MPNETENPQTPEAPAPLPVEAQQAPAPTEAESIFQPPDVETPASVETSNDEEETDESPFGPLLKDIRKHQRRAMATKSLGETRLEFAHNVYPTLEALTEAVDERIGRLENAFDAIIEQTESFLQPDIAKSVADLFNMGKAMAHTLLQFKAGMKLTPDGEKKLHVLAQTFLAAVDPVAKALAEITLDPGEDDDEEEGEDEK